MPLEVCPICEEEFIPIWENKGIKCKKCRSKIKIKNLDGIEEDKLQDWDKSTLIKFINHLLFRVKSLSEEFGELESRIETLGIVVEQSE